MRTFILCLSCWCFCSLAKGQLVKIGTETQVNTTTALAQQHPDVDMNSSGNYVIVWESFEQDGDGFGSYFQMYDNTGATISTETALNSTTNRDQRFPSVSVNDAGGFVAVWNSYNQDGDGWGIYQRLFSDAGVATTTEAIVNQTTTGQQRFPQVAMNGNGGYVVAWESGFDIICRVYGSDGTASTNEITVNSTTGTQSHPKVAIADDGSFVVVWQSLAQDGDGYGVYARLFDSAGTAQTTEVQVNGTTTNSQLSPDVAMNPSGNFVVTWASNLQDTSQEGIYARRFDNSGSALGTEFLVNTTTSGAQDNPAVDMIEEGAFVVTWNSYAQDGSRYGVYQQGYDASGVAVGTELLVNTTTSEFQEFPIVALYSFSTGVIVWQDGNRSSSTSVDGSNQSIIAQRYDAANLPVELTHISAEAINNQRIRVDWTTVSETNNRGFFVERSHNTVEWEMMGFVDGAGNSTSKIDYTYWDENPFAGRNYYRLQQVDFDGKTNYTDIVSDDITDGGFTVFPNPAYSDIQYQVRDMPLIQEVNLFDANGQKVISQNAAFTGRLNLSNLPIGTYLLQIIIQGESFTKHIIVQR